MANNPAEKKPVRFRKIREIIGELKKVTWLSRSETMYLTGMVLVVALVSAVVLGLIDWGFSTFISKVFLGG
jgi:preprotein translocase SecE subunit